MLRRMGQMVVCTFGSRRATSEARSVESRTKRGCGENEATTSNNVAENRLGLPPHCYALNRSTAGVIATTNTSFVANPTKVNRKASVAIAIALAKAAKSKLFPAPHLALEPSTSPHA